MTDEHDQPTLPPSIPTLPAAPPSLPAPSVPAPSLPAPSIPAPAIPAPSIPPPRPAVPSVPPSISPSPPTRPDGSAADDEPQAAAAVRNVPTAASTQVDDGLPTAPPTDAAPWMPPETESMRAANVAFVAGRCLFVAAALLVVLATRRFASADATFDQFWAVVASAGVFVAVGLAGQAFWAAGLADNARRLRVRGVSARGQVILWAIVAGWVAFACSVVLRVDLGGDLDPLPALALGIWVVTVLIAYSRLKAVLAGLSRTPPPVLITLLPIDLVAFGLVWWRLLDLSTARSDLDRTATFALVAAGLLAVAAALSAWLAARATAAIGERLRRLETQHRQSVEGEGPSAEWLQRRAEASSATSPASD